MKVKSLTEKKEKRFKPLKLELVIETEEELAYLWNVTNFAPRIMIEAIDWSDWTLPKDVCSNFNHVKVWDKLNDHALQYTDWGFEC